MKHKSAFCVWHKRVGLYITTILIVVLSVLISSLANVRPLYSCPPDKAEISGTVFNDTNGNYVLDGSETGISGVTITLDGSTSTVTAANGYYFFQVLTAGTHTVVETNPLNIFYSTTPDSITLPSVELGHAYVINFGDMLLSDMPTVAFTPDSQSANESTGTLIVTAQLDKVCGLDVTIPFTLSGTVTDGDDYTITPSPIIIATGSLSTNITISVINDPFYEDDETLIITMGTPTNAYKGTPDVHTITIIDNDPANHPPIANDQTVSTIEDTPVDITLTATDVDGDPLAYSIADSPTHGTLSGTPPSVTYTPDPDYYGVDSFNYKANDGFDDSNTATVTINVYGIIINHSPVANDDIYITPMNTALIAVPGVLFNDTDADGNSLCAVQVTSPLHGTLIFLSDGTFSYTPNTDYTSSDSFTYKASDGLIDSNIATVSISITEKGPEPEPKPEPEPLETAPTLPQPEVEYLTVDFLGNITSQLLGKDYGIVDTLVATSPDGGHMLILPEGTIVRDSEGNIVKLIVIREAGDIYDEPPDYATIIGEAYDFAPSGIVFSNPARLTLGYDVNLLPREIKSVGLAYFTPASGWVDLESEGDVVAGVGKLTAPIEHFTVFAVLSKPTDAALSVNNFLITPLQKTYWKLFPIIVFTGREVTVSINVNNSGGKPGTYGTDLKIDGQTVGEESILFGPSQTGELVITATGLKDGTHSVELGQLKGEFNTSWLVRWWLILIILLLLLVLYWLFNRYVMEK